MSRFLAQPARRGVLLFLLLAVPVAGLLGFAAYRVGAYPPPAAEIPRTLLQGIELGVRSMPDPGAVRQVFGYDARAVAIMPVRLDLFNPGPAVIRILPKRSFLVDRRNLAWPVLTAVEARRRLAPHFAWKSAPAAAAGPAVADLSGFALGVKVRAATAPPMNGKTGPERWLAAILGADPYPLETVIRSELLAKRPGNAHIPAGAVAEAYLFFPLPDAGAEPLELRLAVDRAGTVEILRLPLSTAGPAGVAGN